MILGFSTQLKEKPTYFVEKIWKGIKENISRELYFKIVSQTAPEEMIKQYPIDAEVYDEILPKVHTIREDHGNRWKIGCKIDFFINVRKKNMFRFAPVLPVVSIQNIDILWYRENCNAFPDHRYTYNGKNVRIYVEGLALKIDQIKLLSQNDGFNTLEDFFEYFNTDFEGKIIHWTDLKY